MISIRNQRIETNNQKSSRVFSSVSSTIHPRNARFVRLSAFFSVMIHMSIQQLAFVSSNRDSCRSCFAREPQRIYELSREFWLSLLPYFVHFRYWLSWAVFVIPRTGLLMVMASRILGSNGTSRPMILYTYNCTVLRLSLELCILSFFIR